MRAIQLTRQEAEDLVDLLELMPRPDRLELAASIREAFGMSRRDVDVGRPPTHAEVERAVRVILGGTTRGGGA